MKFTVFKQEFTVRELARTPELHHFSFPEDRLLLIKIRCLSIWPWFVLPGLSGLFMIGSIVYPGLLKPFLLQLVFALVFVAALAFPIVIGLTNYFDSREQFFLHRELHRRGVYYCVNLACRYNCTGIRGNICPECGAEVPGLERGVD